MELMNEGGILSPSAIEKRGACTAGSPGSLGAAPATPPEDCTAGPPGSLGASSSGTAIKSEPSARERVAYLLNMKQSQTPESKGDC